MQITIALWMYILALTPWLQPQAAGLEVVQTSPNQPAIQLFADRTHGNDWHVLMEMKGELTEFGTLTPGKTANFKSSAVMSRMSFGSMPVDVATWLKTPITSQLAQVKAVQLHDGRTLQIRRTAHEITIDDGNGGGVVLRTTGPPRAAGTGQNSGLSMHRPAVVVSKGEAAPKLAGGPSPEATVATMFAKLMANNKHWAKHLSPQLDATLRKSLVAAMTKAAPGLRQITIRSRVYRALSHHVSSGTVRGISENLVMIFGLHDVMLFLEGNTKRDDIFVACRRVAGKWYVQGVISRILPSLNDAIERRMATHRMKSPAPPLGKADENGWRHYKTPVLLLNKRVKTASVAAGDPETLARSFFRAAAKRDDDLMLLFHSRLPLAMMKEALFRRSFKKVQLVARRVVDNQSVARLLKVTGISAGELKDAVQLKIRVTSTRGPNAFLTTMSLGVSMVAMPQGVWRVIEVKKLQDPPRSAPSP